MTGYEPRNNIVRYSAYVFKRRKIITPGYFYTLTNDMSLVGYKNT